jgi:recombination associated protein RdgC
LFRNLIPYRAQRPLEIDAGKLEAALATHPFRPCGGIEMSTQGWVSPLGRSSEVLVHAVDGRLLVMLRRQDRLLPASVTREAVEEKVIEIEETQGREVGRKERANLRDEIEMTLAPRAFVRSVYTYAYIDPAAGWVVVDAGSARQAEELLSELRTALGTLPAALPQLAESPAVVMSEWLAGKGLPPEVVVGDECELRDMDGDGGVVRCRRVDLASDDVQNHLRSGKQVTRLAIAWDERIEFLLNEDMTIRRLRFGDHFDEALEGIDRDDHAARLDANFALMSGEVTPLLNRLVELFGGPLA